jgi:hypothetical protein
MLAVPTTLTAALNTHRTRIVILGQHRTTTNVQEISYAEHHRAATGIRETPVVFSGMGRVGIEPTTLGLRVPCSTS